MTAPNVTEVVLQQGQVLVRAIEALGVIEPSAPFERAIADLPQAAFKRRLRAIVKAAPSGVTEEILSASEHVGGDRAAVWLSDN